MGKETINNLKLGIFISSGLAILVVSLYLIGKNQSFFSANFHVRARFSDINGLMAGNNIRFDGIQAGTVNKVTVLNDTTIEVDMMIDKNIRPYIRKNFYAGIGNEGLMGNKVINIAPNRLPAPEIEDGDLLLTKKALETDDMMETLSSTNNNVEKISERLINTLDKINDGKALWGILNDSSIPMNLSASMANIRTISNKLNEMSLSLNTTMNDIKGGKGTIGVLLEDKKTEDNVKQAIENIAKASDEATSAMNKADSLMASIQKDYVRGHGPVQALLKDSSMVIKLSHSLTNIEKGTAAFALDMEALKHNFLTKKYFRNQARHARDTAQ
jgi:phospholipid/cholesterol/gamma-HCH transport system substrate-binding protein